MRGNDKKPRTLMRISVTEQHAAKLQSLLRYDAENGHVTHLGRFNTPEEASAAYKAARAKAFGEFSA